jgi:formylglycine-generating enzyme required for sulfatase activity
MKNVLVSTALLALILCGAAGISQALGMQEPPTGMVSIPAGEFWMGRYLVNGASEYLVLERDRLDDQPAHQVAVDAFYMDKYEVTAEEYARFVEATGAIKPWYWPGGKVEKGMERVPVHDVTWEEAKSYCAWAGGKRLPTEAEWERAARGGLDRKRNPWGDQGGQNRTADGNDRGPVPVGSVPAQNDYGLFDIVGNVWEWTNDWYQRDYYTISPDSNPQGRLVSTRLLHH